MELRGSRLHVAVSGHDPDLLRFLTSKGEADHSLSLLIVDQVASAWGVRQDPAGGKVAWCTLELPPQQVAETDPSPAEAAGRPGFELVWSKLRPPALRAGLVPRAGLLSLLQQGVQARLCLLDAPTGFGKTTLLGQWRVAAGGGRVAWLSVDEEDNDPARLWVYVAQALRTVEPEVGTAAPRRCGAPAPTSTGWSCRRCSTTCMPSPRRCSWSWTTTTSSPTRPATRHSASSWTTSRPASMALAARADPPLALARMRARGLVELRVAELRFTHEEASAP